MGKKFAPWARLVDRKNKNGYCEAVSKAPKRKQTPNIILFSLNLCVLGESLAPLVVEEYNHGNIRAHKGH